MRLRITFGKTGALIYVGNLDLYTIWERAARRAGLSLAYSKGFHPQPKIHLASPLPLGFSSRCEVADVWLNEDMDPSEIGPLADRLQAVVPAGLEIMEIETVPPAERALQAELIASEYEVTCAAGADRVELEQRIGQVLEAASLPRQRRDKSYDLRPLIETLQLIPSAPGARPIISMRLKAQEGATGRPEEVLDELHISLEDAQVQRTRLIFRN